MVKKTRWTAQERI